MFARDIIIYFAAHFIVASTFSRARNTNKNAKLCTGKQKLRTDTSSWLHLYTYELSTEMQSKNTIGSVEQVRNKKSNAHHVTVILTKVQTLSDT